jgi:transposase
MRCELTAFDKGKIVGCQLCGKSVREIANITGYPRSTIHSFLKKYEQDGVIESNRRSGRPPIMQPRDKRSLVRLVKAKRRTSLKEITVNYNANATKPVSVRTMQRNLHSLGFYGRAGVRKPFVSEQNRKRRIKWCKERLNWTQEQWYKIVWSDESRFTLYQSDGRNWV